MDIEYRTIVIGVVSQLLGVITMVIPIDSHQQPPLPRHPHAGEVLGNGCCVAPLAPSSPANWKLSPTSRPQWGKIMAADSWCNAGPWNNMEQLARCIEGHFMAFYGVFSPKFFFLFFVFLPPGLGWWSAWRGFVDDPGSAWDGGMFRVGAACLTLGRAHVGGELCQLTRTKGQQFNFMTWSIGMLPAMIDV